MKILSSAQRPLLLNYMAQLRSRISEWLIVEVTLIDVEKQDITGAEIAMLLTQLFHAYEGRIFVCNRVETLMLIEWGKDNPLEKLVRTVHDHLPPDICETTVEPPTKDGIKRIEMLLCPAGSEYELYYMARAFRHENVFLVVDDDMYMRQLTKTSLQKLGAVVEVSDSRQVILAYKQHNPDIVLLDIHMPGLGGQEVLDQLKELDPKAYVIMLSADSSLENVQAAQKRGAEGFLAKPYNKGRLFEYIIACLTIT